MSLHTDTLSSAGAGLAGYQPLPGIYDEMTPGGGALRSHWQNFVTAIDELGPAEQQRRWRTARQLIHENGVTYNVYGDPDGMDRPWHIDPMPLLISASEWSVVESGLTQRARLLDAILADFYGPQKLVQQRVLPPELLYANRGFLRPMHGLKVPGGHWLHLYGADVGRGPGGELVVLHDRTQAPSGAGYALENRLVVSRAFPDVFRDCRVQRLATFFRTIRETLTSLAPHHRESPRIVLLTPGPYNETYFEHAYLARYLGYMLAEGGDLTVRDNHVYLKTLGGLQQVDVIVRRQDDDFCDPLELRPDSSIGVPGLVQALHAGNVAVANALGSGLLETPALMAFLPQLCRHLLGEDLKMQSVPTYWCGRPDHCQFVLGNLEKMVIKPTLPGRHEIVFGQSLTADQKAELRRKIADAPRMFVAQERLTLSTAPVMLTDRAEPRHVVVRAHLAASENGYVIMPGGLTRFSASVDTMTVSMQRGGGSKDTWVLTDGPVDTFSLLPQPGVPIDISRAGGDLPSRVADNLYWLGRYMERAEAQVRLARGIAVRLSDQSIEDSPEFSRLLAAFLGEDMAGAPAAEIESRVIAALIDQREPFGLQSALSNIHRLASLVRDRISIDTWRIINRFEQDFPFDAKSSVRINELLPALDRLILTFAAFSGLAMESMTRGFAWRFLDMGHRIERALATLNLLQNALVPVLPREAQLYEIVLEIADSLMTYRRRYMTTLQAAPVLDLLLADESNPRSVAFQLVMLSEHVAALPKPIAGVMLPEDRLLLKCLTELRLTDVMTAAEPQNIEDADSPRRILAEASLSMLGESLSILSELMSQTYLSHAVTTRQLALGPTPMHPQT